MNFGDKNDGFKGKFLVLENFLESGKIPDPRFQTQIPDPMVGSGMTDGQSHYVGAPKKFVKPHNVIKVLIKWVSSNKKKTGQKVAILINKITHPFKTKLLGHSTKPLLCPSNILERVRDPTSCYKTITLYYNNSRDFCDFLRFTRPSSIANAFLQFAIQICKANLHPTYLSPPPFRAKFITNDPPYCCIGGSGKSGFE